LLQVFDEEGKLADFELPVLHVLNKYAASINHKSAFFEEEDYAHRRNLLLLGDSLGDLNMVHGLEYDHGDGLLRVGYLNDRVDERKSEYLDRFDVVLLGDGDLSFVCELLQSIN
jgi:5'-nucleotidase